MAKFPLSSASEESIGQGRRTYMDVDPGHDDAFALIVALKRLRVAGVTTVAGNTTVDKTFLNAQRILSVADASDVPVMKGSDRPLKRPLVTAEFAHGSSGLDGHSFGPLKCNPIEGDGVRLLARALMAEPDPVDLIATGPLTNVGKLLQEYPEVVQNLSRLFLMGGAFWVTGNITEFAEFNAYVDPEAAEIVGNSGLPLWIVGLDVTNKALFPLNDISRLREIRHEIGGVLADLLDFCSRWPSVGREKGIPVHDVLAVYAACAPERFEWTRGHLLVEKMGEKRGRTTVEGGTGASTASVAKSVDTVAFLDWVWDTLHMYEIR